MKKIHAPSTDRTKKKRKPVVGRWLMKRPEGTFWISSGMYPRSEFEGGGFSSSVVRLATEEDFKKHGLA